jgi:methylated-DNA-[protein]-cysteine S-methyltransferase
VSTSPTGLLIAEHRPCATVSGMQKILTIAETTLPVLGRVLAAGSERGLCAVALPAWGDHDLRLQAWEAAGWHPRRGASAITDQALDDLRTHAAGTPGTPRVPFDWRHLPPFTVRVLRSLLTVPPGTLITYGRLAVLAGAPGAARAVGGAVGRNPLPVLVPCHRVVAADGIGGFGLGLACKRALLDLEGVAV